MKNTDLQDFLNKITEPADQEKLTATGAQP